MNRQRIFVKHICVRVKRREIEDEGRMPSVNLLPANIENRKTGDKAGGGAKASRGSGGEAGVLDMLFPAYLEVSFCILNSLL